MDGIWHRVKQGEWITKIAAQYGIADWKAIIWNHPNNADLAKRRDSNILHPADRVFIPRNQPKELPCATDQTHTFVLQRAWDEFHTRLLYDDDRPIAHEKYTLSIGNQRFKGETDDAGAIHQSRIDPIGQAGSHHGLLELPELRLRFYLKVGDLNPASPRSQTDGPPYDDGVSGLLMRLRNLGYDPGNSSDDIFLQEDQLPAEVQGAIADFQQIEMGLAATKITGNFDPDTRLAILAKHGC
jgi:hypothetical protein